MKKYPEYKQLDLSQINKEVLEYWKKNNIFSKSIEKRPRSKPFSFYEGPPSANGLPGIHHVISRTIKDAFCRFKTMKGFRVERKAGWDTHGLPVELSVEKDLSINQSAIIDGSLNVGSDVSINGMLTVNNDVNILGTLFVSGDFNTTQDISLTGDLYIQNDF